MDHIHHVGFGELTYKSAEDGTMTVYGKATGPDLDLDQQICDPEWLKTAMPQWLATGANVREMHQSIAAGVGLEIAADGDDWSLKAEVVDESTMRKVEKKVLKGFSIGIKGARIVKDEKAKGGRIVAGQIVEISLVDRPANPTCLAEIAKVYGGGELEIAKGLEPLIPDTQQNVGNMPQVQQEVIHSSHPGAKDADDVYPAEQMCAACHGTGKTVDTQETCEMCGGEGKHPASMVTPNDFESLAPEIAKKEVTADIEKKEYTDKQRENAAASGAALPDGSYPIKTVGDLKNAIQSFGRAKDKAATKEHIKTRAKALGKENLLPESWNTDSTEKMEHNADDLAAVRQSLINLMKAELDEMAAGEEDEVCDVGNLLRALDLFMCWWQNEANEEETTSPYMNESEGQDTMAYIGLGVESDLIKRATSEEATEEVREELRAELRKALGVDTEIAIQKAEIEAQKKDVEALKSVLEEVRSMATPGGPSLRATQAQASKSADADRLEMEASYFRRMAEAVDNPSLKNGYLAKALEAEADYKKLIRN